MALFLAMNFMVITLNSARADEAMCKKTLRACDELVNGQEEELRVLKEQVSILEDRLKVDQNTNILPDWAWLVIGVGLGVTTGLAVSH